MHVVMEDIKKIVTPLSENTVGQLRAGGQILMSVRYIRDV